MLKRSYFKFTTFLFLLVITAHSAQAKKVCRTVNDFSGLNQTCVSAVLTPRNSSELIDAIRIAKKKGWKVSMAGSQHSMAGQSIAPGGLFLNIKGYNKILGLDSREKTLRVQAGATWKQIQKFLDPKGFAVDIMQNYNIFTVGGSLSVNAIGWNTNSSTIASNVKSLLVLTADGELIRVDRSKNSELFSLILGGYGLFGIILEVELQVVQNSLYRTSRHIMNYREFPRFFDRKLMNKDAMMQTFLSLDPSSFMREVLVLDHIKRPTMYPVPRMDKVNSNKKVEDLITKVINASKGSKFLRKVVWSFQKTLMSNSISKRITRNQLLSASMPNIIRDWNREALIIQTYFIPKKEFTDFINHLRVAVQDMDMPIIGATIIHTKKDDTAFLSAMKNGDRFAITLIFIQKRTNRVNQKMDKFSRRMIHEVARRNGAVYLAHRPSLSPYNLRKIYPVIDDFLSLKKKYDPEELFSNIFYENVLNVVE